MTCPVTRETSVFVSLSTINSRLSTPWRPQSGELRRQSERTREQLARFGIVENALGLRVPPKLSLHQHRNQPQVPWDCRVMGDLGRRDGWLPRFDAVQEIAVMVR